MLISNILIILISALSLLIISLNIYSAFLNSIQKYYLIIFFIIILFNVFDLVTTYLLFRRYNFNYKIEANIFIRTLFLNLGLRKTFLFLSILKSLISSFTAYQVAIFFKVFPLAKEKIEAHNYDYLIPEKYTDFNHFVKSMIEKYKIKIYDVKIKKDNFILNLEMLNQDEYTPLLMMSYDYSIPAFFILVIVFGNAIQYIFPKIIITYQLYWVILGSCVIFIFFLRWLFYKYIRKSIINNVN